MLRAGIVTGAALFAAACATTYPSARLAGPGCAPTPEAMARVTYAEKSTYIELGCLGCSEVYLAAEQSWLQAYYPRHTVKQHYSTSTFIGDPGPARDKSCWVIQTADGQERDVCFSDSGWCRERKSRKGDSPHNYRMDPPTGGRSQEIATARSPAAGHAGR